MNDFCLKFSCSFLFHDVTTFLFHFMEMIFPLVRLIFIFTRMGRGAGVRTRSVHKWRRVHCFPQRDRILTSCRSRAIAWGPCTPSFHLNRYGSQNIVQSLLCREIAGLLKMMMMMMMNMMTREMGNSVMCGF